MARNLRRDDEDYHLDLQVSVIPPTVAAILENSDPYRAWFGLIHDFSETLSFQLLRMDKYRPKKDDGTSDMTFEAHVYFDDAFKDVPGSHGRHVNEYAEMLVNIIREVYG